MLYLLIGTIYFIISFIHHYHYYLSLRTVLNYPAASRHHFIATNVKTRPSLTAM